MLLQQKNKRTLRLRTARAGIKMFLLSLWLTSSVKKNFCFFFVFTKGGQYAAIATVTLNKGTLPASVRIICFIFFLSRKPRMFDTVSRYISCNFTFTGCGQGKLLSNMLAPQLRCACAGASDKKTAPQAEPQFFFSFYLIKGRVK